MTQSKSHRGSGRKTLAQQLNQVQKNLGLSNGDQCLPDTERNTGIEEDRTPNLNAAVQMRIQSIKRQGIISEEMATKAKITADMINKYGVAMLYGKYFIESAWAIAVLSFQPKGYEVFGLHFKSELKNGNS